MTNQTFDEQLKEILTAYRLASKYDDFIDPTIEAVEQIKAAIREHTPARITAGSIELGILANYSRTDNADTQRVFNKALDEVEEGLGL